MRPARRVAACAVLVGGALSFAVAGPPPAAAGPGPDRPDFNDDGFADLVVGVPFEGTGGTQHGVAQVLYGDADGLLPRDSVHAPADAPDGSAELSGSAVATGDFDDDGFDDLAVGVPGDDLQFVPLDRAGTDAVVSSPVPPFDPSAGSVGIWYGSPTGVSGDRRLEISQDTPGINGNAEPTDQFGAALAAGDFDGDGFDDLAVGSPQEDFEGSFTTGVVHVLWGSAGGISGAGSRMLTQATLGGVVEDFDLFGFSLAAGNLDADGTTDLVIGAPGEGLAGDAFAAGAAFAAAGPADRGFDPDAVKLHQNVPGVTGTAELRDLFGFAVAIGDMDGDGDGDVAAGAPGETLGGLESAGAVHLFEGAPAGLTTAEEALWEGHGLGGTTEALEELGRALVFGDLDLDGADDLAIGVPGQRVGAVDQAGGVHVVPGEAVLPADPPSAWTQVPLRGGPEQGDGFGSALAAADYTGDGTPDLAVGVPAETVSGAQAGVVAVVAGSPTGLTAAGNTLVHQGLAEVKGTAEDADRFGHALG